MHTDDRTLAFLISAPGSIRRQTFAPVRTTHRLSEAFICAYLFPSLQLR